MNFHHDRAQLITRRHFFRRCNSGLGAVALASLLGNDLLANAASPAVAPPLPRPPPTIFPTWPPS